MGVLAAGSAHASPATQPPIDMNGKNLNKTLKTPPMGQGEGVVSDLFVSLESFYFVDQEPMQNFPTLGQPLLGEWLRRRKKEKYQK